MMMDILYQGGSIMTTASSPEFDALKSRLKSTWMAGDFSQIAKCIESTAETFVDRLNIQPGTKVLDVACGSGNLAIPAAKKGADVTGVDIADNLVAVAKHRAADAGVQAKFEVGDAEALPYQDNTFDIVMTMFGAMFAPRPEVVADELVRVCKPGGTIAMANWTPEGLPGQMFKLATKYIPPPDLPPPVLWGVPGKVSERFGDKVTDLTMTPVMADMIFDRDPAGVVELFRTYFGPTMMAFKAIPEDQHEAYRSDMESLFAENNIATDGTTHEKGEFLEVRAVKK
jgi:ubiquinone/menaquinone biosynthesis C-methylase UbiE